MYYIYYKSLNPFRGTYGSPMTPPLIIVLARKFIQNYC